MQDQDEAILKRFSNLQETNTKEDLQVRLMTKGVCHKVFTNVVAFMMAEVPPGRCRNLALTDLETALMYANKAIMND